MIRRRDLLGLTALLGLSATTSAAASLLQSRMRNVPLGFEPHEHDLPDHLGTWHRQPVNAGMVDPIEFDGAFVTALDVYDAIVAAGYATSALASPITLNLAYRRHVRNEDRFHWPEVCYATQGYDVQRLGSTPVGRHSMPFARFLATSTQRTEMVGYLIIVGGRPIAGPGQLRLALIHDALNLRISDGLLFRVSTPVSPDQDPREAWGQTARFLGSLLTDAPYFSHLA